MPGLYSCSFVQCSNNAHEHLLAASLLMLFCWCSELCRSFAIVDEHARPNSIRSYYDIYSAIGYKNLHLSKPPGANPATKLTHALCGSVVFDVPLFVVRHSVHVHSVVCAVDPFFHSSIAQTPFAALLSGLKKTVTNLCYNNDFMLCRMAQQMPPPKRKLPYNPCYNVKLMYYFMYFKLYGIQPLAMATATDCFVLDY